MTYCAECTQKQGPLKEAFIKALSEEQVSLIRAGHSDKGYNLSKIAEILFPVTKDSEVEKHDNTCATIIRISVIIGIVAIVALLKLY